MKSFIPNIINKNGLNEEQKELVLNKFRNALFILYGNSVNHLQLKLSMIDQTNIPKIIGYNPYSSTRQFTFQVHVHRNGNDLLAGQVSLKLANDRKLKKSDDHTICINNDFIKQYDSHLWDSKTNHHVKKIEFKYTANFVYINHKITFSFDGKPDWNTIEEWIKNWSHKPYKKDIVISMTFNSKNEVIKVRRQSSTADDARVYVVEWGDKIFSIQSVILMLIFYNERKVFEIVFPELNEDTLIENNIDADDIHERFRLVDMLMI